MKKILFITSYILFLQFLFSQLKPNQLRVDGRYLKDGAGNTIRLIGINHPHAWYRGYLGAALDGIRSWGANSVRVVLSNGVRWTKIPAHEVATIISESRNRGFKAIVLEVHDTTGYGDQSGASTLDQAVDYWIEIKNVLDGQEDFVIINIGNEPVGNNSSYVSQWANWTKSAIQRLRNNGFTHVIMVDAPNWGQDWTNTMRNNAADVLNSDSLRNTIFSVHMYEVYDNASKVQNYMSYYYNNNLPLCIGEFGHYHNGREVDEQAIVNYAKQYGYSIFGWSWCGNGGGYEYLDMVYNWDPNSPTQWGSWFKSNALSDVQVYYTLTVNISPQGGGSVSLNPSGGSYTAGTQVTLTAVANSGYVFSSWSGDLSGTQNPATITMDSNKVVTANFTLSGGGGTTYTLSVNVSPTGSGVVYLDPSGGVYTAGTQVTLTAVANSGYVFSSWSGDLSGTQNPATITMDSNKVVTANFTLSGGGGTTYTLSVNVSPTGSGVVYLDPSGGVYTAGTQVTLTAVANSGYVFSSWSGDLSGTQNPATITMDSNKLVTANFTQQQQYSLNIVINPQGSGVVSINPFKGSYTAGEQVQLTAMANNGYVFSSWSGDLSGTQNPTTITMDTNKTIVANFVQSGSGNGSTMYTLSVRVLPESAGRVYLNPSGGVYTAGTQVELIAEANIGYIFSDWSGSLVSTQNPVTITMDENKVIIANFSQNFINYTLTVNINPEGSGIVRMEPSGGVYTAGTQVTLTAEGYGLYEFSFWSGDLTGSQNPVTITMDNNKIITANFVYYPPSTISVSIDKNPFYISKDKEVVFTYSISENNNNNVIMELNLRIYDIKMNLVREIKKYNLSSTGTITWDGKDNFGFLVGPGIYLYKISTDKQNSNKLGKMLVLQ